MTANKGELGGGGNKKEKRLMDMDDCVMIVVVWSISRLNDNRKKPQ